jgi:hypothetical protein
MEMPNALLVICLAAALFAPVASAADRPNALPAAGTNVAIEQLPFPRSERAQSVWASGRCWSECGSYCASGQTECLQRDGQAVCLKRTDRCDRYCQRTCRTSGGPLLPDIFDF